MTNTCSVSRTRAAVRPASVPEIPRFDGYDTYPLGADCRRGVVVRPAPARAVAAPVEQERLRVGKVARPSRRVIIRRRVVLAAAVAMMLIMLALPWGGTGGRSLATPGAAPVGSLAAGTNYVVHRGDTLWGIAERLAHGSDPRPIVAQLESQNHGDTLQPGEVLHLP